MDLKEEIEYLKKREKKIEILQKMITNLKINITPFQISNIEDIVKFSYEIGVEEGMHERTFR